MIGGTSPCASIIAIKNIEASCVNLFIPWSTSSLRDYYSEVAAYVETQGAHKLWVGYGGCGDAKHTSGGKVMLEKEVG